ncbi:alpha-L-fucosidase [Pelobium sp.]|nr:alpha-L-fucosidase [Pelobium sp.]MDA9554614.1 alpha-L-fucosidase [Pelobium sp.]
MKKLFICLFAVIIAISSYAQTNAPVITTLETRSQFQDAKFGLFIHWGVFSIMGDGEWVMNQKNIPINNYKKLTQFFNPTQFDAKAWVSMAKNAGMKYITLITRHHDGFSLWDTKYSDFNIMNTPYKKDVVKMIVDECHKQDMKIFLYYSLLDWGRDDYSWWTGKTGQGTGRTVKGDWNDYIGFMKNQLTELLTNYGKIDGIWFDGYWDQTGPKDGKDKTPRVDWHLPEIYALIHKLQPQCLVGNNHHIEPIAGEDFQMFEKDLPGQNKSGFSEGKPSDDLPLETCETMNGSWGFNIKDSKYKSVPQLIHYLVNAAGRNANFLLNVGPQPNGVIQQEFVDTLQKVGNWMTKYGASIYETRGNVIPAQDWGVVTVKGKTMYVHLLDASKSSLVINDFKEKIKDCILIGTNQKVAFKNAKEQLTLNLEGIQKDNIDTIIQITLK